MNSNEGKCTGARPKVRIYQPSGEQINTNQGNNASTVTTSLLKFAEDISEQQIKSAIKIASQHHNAISEE